jgi:predicted transcriptional regulator
MSAPMIKVAEKTDLRENARILATHGMQRVPVVHDGRVVGVSRADLVRALVARPHIPVV